MLFRSRRTLDILAAVDLITQLEAYVVNRLFDKEDAPMDIENGALRDIVAPALTAEMLTEFRAMYEGDLQALEFYLGATFEAAKNIGEANILDEVNEDSEVWADLQVGIATLRKDMGVV